MRKKYIKPLLMVESFTLTQSIALNCGAAYAGPDGIKEGVGKPNLHDIESCTFDLYGTGDMIVFLTSTKEQCDQSFFEEPLKTIDDFKGYFEEFCYQAPSEDSAVFDS